MTFSVQPFSALALAALSAFSSIGLAAPSQVATPWAGVASPTLDYRPDTSPGAKAFAALKPFKGRAAALEALAHYLLTRDK